MTLRELFQDKDFLFDTNFELAIYRLLESCGVDKQDILDGVYDESIKEFERYIFKLLGEDKLKQPKK